MSSPLSATSILSSLAPNAASSAGGGGAAGTGFGTELKAALDQVEQLHTEAQEQVGNLLQGNGPDIHNVMIAVEKADVSFQLMMQVRNKIVSAYQEVSHLQF